MFDRLKLGASYSVAVYLRQNKQEIPRSVLNLTTCVSEGNREINGLKQSSALQRLCCFAEPELYPLLIYQFVLKPLTKMITYLKSDEGK